MLDDSTRWLSAVGLSVTLALTLMVALHPVSAQSGPRVRRIGWLDTSPLRAEEQHRQSPGTSRFLEGLGEWGWLEGQNLVIEWRHAGESAERLAALAAELVQLRVDVLVAGDSRAIPAVQRATKTIPIVMTVSSDPVASGYVTSLAQPGGNITGLAN